MSIVISGALTKAVADGRYAAKALAVDSSDVGYDVVLLIGQSNEVGYGVGADTTYLDVADPRVKQYPSTGSYVGQIVTAVDPLFHHELRGSGVGHGLTFAKEYVRTLPENRRVLLVPCAHGSTGFTSTSITPAATGFVAGAGTWAPGGAGVNLYAFAVAQVNAALALNPKNRLAAVLWLQGETDRYNMNQATYGAALDNLITNLRTDVPGAASAPFILGQMLPDSFSTDALLGPINLAHIDTPRRVQRSAFVYGPSGIQYQNGDNQHYSAAGQRVLGLRYFDALTLARANVTGGPVLAPSAVLLAPAGTTVDVTWTRPICRVTDYVVQWRPTGGTWATLSRSQSIDAHATLTGLVAGSSYDVQVATVNDSGTSSYSPIATASTYVAPGQVTGLAAGTTTASSVPLAWTAISGATGYLVEYRVTGSGSWITANTATSNSMTVGGLASSTGYDFRVTASNPGGSGATSATVTASTAAAVPLLDVMGLGAWRAYGLRKLSSTFTGSAVRVRRAADSVESDIGFTAAGNLDTTALLAFAGTDTLYVKTLYDQSGGAHDLTQATTTRQARIVNAGTLDAANGKPTMVMDGTNVYYVDTAGAGMYAAGAASGVTVFKSSSTAATSVFCAEGGSGGTAGSEYIPWYLSSDKPTTKIQDSSGSALLQQSGGSGYGISSLRQQAMVDTGSSVGLWLDGVANPAAGSYSRASRTMTLTAFSLGAFFGTAPAFLLAGSLSELVVFTVALSTSQRQSAADNQKGYFGTP